MTKTQTTLFKKKKIVLRIVLTNRWAIFKCSPERQQKLKKYFKYHPKGYEFAPSYKEGAWDGCINLLLRGRVPSGLFLKMQARLEQKYSLRITDQRIVLAFNKSGITDVTKEDRVYQSECLKVMKECSTGGIILIGTGGGKTFIAGQYFKDLKGNGLFIVDELLLLEQTRLEFESVIGEKIGIIGKSQFNPERISVATIQTLQKHRKTLAFRKWFITLETVMIDEFHIAMNKRNIDVVYQIKPRVVFGLTATLQLDKPEIAFPAYALAGPVIFEYSIQQGVEDKHMTQGVVCCVEFKDSLRKPTPGYWTVVKKERTWINPWTRSSEYRFHICLNKSRNDMIESLVREGLKRDERIIVLVERINHLKVLIERFKDVNHRVLCGDKKLSGTGIVRLKALKDMDAGKVPLIIANRVMGKGANVKTVTVVIDGTALPGHDNAIQRYGRGVRKADGKHELLYINIADTGNKLAHTAQLREEALRKTGARIVKVVWNNNPKEVYDV